MGPEVALNFRTYMQLFAQARLRPGRTGAASDTWQQRVLEPQSRDKIMKQYILEPLEELWFLVFSVNLSEAGVVDLTKVHGSAKSPPTPFTDRFYVSLSFSD